MRRFTTYTKPRPTDTNSPPADPNPCSADAHACAPTATPELPSSILFFGDSDAFWLDRHLKNLAASGDPPRVIETLGVTSGGASLEEHWNLTLGPKAIKEGSWDVVVLNQELYMPQPWKEKTDPPLAEDYAEVYGKIGEELGAKVAPAGLAWPRRTPGRVMNGK